MAITNHERAGKALALQRAGLGPFAGHDATVGGDRVHCFRGTAALDSKHVGCDASRIVDEVISRLARLAGASVEATIEVEAEIPSGFPDNVVRTVIENSRTLKFTSHGFESE